MTTEDRIRTLIPQELYSCRQTLRLALQRITQEGSGETCWSDECLLQPPEWIKSGDAPYAGGLVLECGYRIRVQAPAGELFELIRGLGGRRGWYHGTILWRARGLLDRIAGGAGLHRGRRHPDTLMVGDALDFWRVVDMEPPLRMRLMAEMKMPGEALLDFRLIPLGTSGKSDRDSAGHWDRDSSGASSGESAGRSAGQSTEELSRQVVEGGPEDQAETEVVMLARFLPRGILGLLYWYAVYPLHHVVFRGLLRGVAEASGRPVTAGPARFTPIFHFLYQSPAGRQ